MLFVLQIWALHHTRNLCKRDLNYLQSNCFIDCFMRRLHLENITCSLPYMRGEKRRLKKSMRDRPTFNVQCTIAREQGYKFGKGEGRKVINSGPCFSAASRRRCPESNAVCPKR